MSNFIPHETKKIKPRDNPWITKPLKAMINKKNRLYRNYKRHGYQLNDKNRLDNFRREVQKAVENAKKTYLLNLGNRLHNEHTNGKIYWKIINKVLNKKAPKIPPLLVDNKFILDCKDFSANNAQQWLQIVFYHIWSTEQLIRSIPSKFQQMT